MRNVSLYLFLFKAVRALDCGGTLKRSSFGNCVYKSLTSEYLLRKEIIVLLERERERVIVDWYGMIKAAVRYCIIFYYTVQLQIFLVTCVLSLWHLKSDKLNGYTVWPLEKFSEKESKKIILAYVVVC